MNREDLRARTIINLKELIEMLETDDIASMYNKKNTIKSIPITQYDRLRIQTTKDLVKLSNIFKN